MEWWHLAAFWIGLASLLALGVTLLDKYRARRNGARVPERVLLGVAWVGGSPGLALGMIVARHKTRKASFQFKFLAVLVIQGAAAWFLLAEGYL